MLLNLKALNASSVQRLRSVLYNKETTQEVITSIYADWVSNNQYMIFEQKRHRSPVRQIASLIPKSGNPKYAWKVRKQWREFALPFEYQQKLDTEKGELTPIDETTTNVLFVISKCMEVSRKAVSRLVFVMPRRFLHHGFLMASRLVVIGKQVLKQHKEKVFL